MLNRRQLRVRVLHMLYAYQNDGEDTNLKLWKKKLHGMVDTVEKEFYFIAYIISQLSLLEEADVKQRADKWVPTEEDKRAIAKMAENPFIKVLQESSDLAYHVKKHKLAHHEDASVVRSIFREVKKSSHYREYLASENDPQKDRKFLVAVFNHYILPNELFQQHFEEIFITWPVDEETVEVLVNKFLKNFPYQVETPPDLYQYPPSWDEDMKFMEQLFEVTLKSGDEFSDFVANKSKNWDVERLAVLDNIILKMAISEFLYFESIPVKVSLNEYIDISKNFSTPKSKKFVNGVLDKILKSFKDEGKIKKTGRGLQE
jgi:N utilization substance protein B